MDDDIERATHTWASKQAMQIAGAALTGTCSTTWILWAAGTSTEWILLAIAIGLTVAVVFWFVARIYGQKLEEKKKKKPPEVGTVKIKLNRW